MVSIPRTEFVRRRKHLMQLASGAAIVVPAAPERIRSNDAHYPYRQDSDLVYLTGFHEPEAVLVMVPGRAQGQVILFCRERDPERERWDGPRMGPEAAVAALGVDDAFPIDDIDDILPNLIEGREQVYYPFGRDPEFDLKVFGWINFLRTQARRGARPPQSLVALGCLVNEQRLIKSKAELKVMQHSADIAVKAHLRAMQCVRPGMKEFQVEAEIMHVFREHAAVPAYESIIGAGANACILHYRANNAELRAGDLLLIDAGAEYHCYASDITRTFPINGVFSEPQRALYELVLAAQEAAIARCRVGKVWSDIHDTALAVLVRGMVALGLLKGSVSKIIRDESYKAFFPHKSGHWLGLDVHDVGDYRIDGAPRVLEPGMVLTVEPGLYIPSDAKSVDARWRGIGVRIEDDVVVTAGEPHVLTAAVPKRVSEVESWMAAARAKAA